MAWGLAAKVVMTGLKLVSWPVRHPITSTFVIAASQATGIGEQFTDPVVELGGKSISWAIRNHGAPAAWDMLDGTAAGDALALAGIDSEEKLIEAYNDWVGSDPEAAAAAERDAPPAGTGDPETPEAPAASGDEEPAAPPAREEEEGPGILDAGSANVVYNLIGERLGIDRNEFDTWWQRIDPVEFGKKSLWVKGADTAIDTITGIDLLTTKQCIMISLAWHMIDKFGVMDKAAEMFKGMFGDRVIPTSASLREDGLGFRDAVTGPRAEPPPPPAIREEFLPRTPAPVGLEEPD